MGAVPHANPASGAFGGTPIWWQETREGCAKMGAVTYASAATGALGGAPYRTTKRVRGVPKWARSHMRALPLEPSVELLMGPRNV